jgi:hypothetical protein
LGSIASVLGHDVVAAAIADALSESDVINVIQGPPGAGKSWIAKGIGALWEEGGGSALVAEGDLLQSDAPLYPLSFALAGLAPIWRSVGQDLARVGTAGERIGGTGGVITATAQALIRLRPARVRARKLYLGEAEQSILFDLSRLARKRPLLLIADNLHWWDIKSLELLGRLREARMSEAFPFLTQLRVIAVQTIEPYQRTCHPEARDALLESARTRYHDITKPSKEVFPEILVELGAPPDQASEAADAVYRLTGGHLALAARCAKRMQNDTLPELLTDGGDEEFLDRLLTDRLRALGRVGSGALVVLQIAAVLGLTFRRAELVCASGEEPVEVARMLRACRDEDVLELSDTIGRFAHDIFRRHFLRAGAGDSPAVHDAVAACLRTLRPGEYELRCFHALGAEQCRDAAILGALAMLKLDRDGMPAERRPELVVRAVVDAGMEEAVHALIRAANARNRSELALCRDILDSLPRRLPKQLAAEADCIRAACLIATRNEEDREAGLALLEAWDGYEVEEPELGLRLLHERLYGLALGVDKRKGRALEARIRGILIDRAEFDQTCEDTLYTLDRCSGSLHEPDVSLIRVEEATRHFRPTAEGDVVRRPAELYRCLVNLVAKQVTNARYVEALDTNTELEQLIADYSEGVFPRLDFPRSTAVLAAFRAGKLSADEACRRQEEIVRTCGAPSDPFYPDNALAVYHVMAGRTEEAHAIFRRLRDQLVERSSPAPSIEYLIEANWCASRYVSEDPAAAARDWRALTDLVERIPYTMRKYLIARHGLLAEIMEQGAALGSATELDRCLLATPRFGPLWDQVGRAFWMPEVEWWH